MIESQPEDNDSDISKEMPAITQCRVSRRDKLDLCNRKFNIIPNGLLDLKHLQYLYLEGNMLQNLPLEFCENLTFLIWLDLRRNVLTSLPENISSLRKLKHLLVESNKLERLPLQLGNLENLSGLNLRYNPLKFPPERIRVKGTKEILKYLHEYRINPDGCDEIFEEVKEAKSIDVPIKAKERMHRVEKSESAEYPVEYFVNDIPENSRQLSLDEKMLQLLYSVNSLEITERKKVQKHSLPTLTKHKYVEPLKRSKKEKTAWDENQSNSNLTYMRKEPVKLKYQREIEQAERRKFNETTDKTVQKKKSKKMLDDWRRKNVSKIKSSPASAKSKHEFVIPYGHDVLPGIDKKQTNSQEEGPAAYPLRQTRVQLDEKLESRIKQHVENIKNWRRQNIDSSAGQKLSSATKNLEKTQQLQKRLDEQNRVREYRLRAFTGEEFAPKPHADLPNDRF